MNLTYEPFALPGLSFDGGVYYQGSMEFDPANTYQLNGFTRVDLGAGYEVHWSDRPIRFRLRVENAFDKRFYYGFANGYQVAAPRTVEGSVSVRF